MVDLTPYNTLRIPALAENLIEISSLDQLQNLISQGAFNKPYLTLGHGANILFTRDFPGTVFKINFSGIEIVEENSDFVLVKTLAGQDWHELVMWSVGKNLSGLENMALIPGTVGAAVVGNIAAYGQNQDSVFESAETLNLTTDQQKTWDKQDCEFTYRESIFKRNEYKKYLIISANYRLSKSPQTDTTYHASRHASLLQELNRLREATKNNSGAGLSSKSSAGRTPAPTRQSEHDLRQAEPKNNFSVAEIAQAVINLRTSKLPDWTKIGTAGSFFKNPLVTKAKAADIKKLIPDLQIYPTEKLSYTDPSISENSVKLPAGMLLDELGWKGKTIGHVSTSPSHALVIINNGGTGREVYAFAEQMRESVKSAYDIDLEYEVVII